MKRFADLRCRWPGNVRASLKNTLERAVALETRKQISLESIPERITNFYQEFRSNGPGIKCFTDSGRRSGSRKSH